MALTLIYIIIATFLVSLLSFIGVLTLLLKEELLDEILFVFVAFSAGALIGGAFLHLIPEAIEKLKTDRVLDIFLYLLLGFCTFFILEHFIKWHHHHAREHPQIKPFSYLILFSDAIHNFIDGLVIAASFVTSFQVGLVTTLAVTLHEIPQEIGDFGTLLYGGFKKSKALFLNFLSAIFAILGGVVGFLISEKMGQSIVFLLPFAAGNFIYISSSDLIPEIRHQQTFKKSFISFVVFLLGILLMLFFKINMKSI